MNRLLAWLVLLVALLTSGWASASWPATGTTTWQVAIEAPQLAAGTAGLRLRPAPEPIVAAHPAGHDTTSEHRVGHGAECLRLAESHAARGALRFGADDLVYGPSARGALRQLQESAGGRLLTDVGGPAAGQSWTQFSIQTLQRQLAGGGRIRFDLSNMKDIPGALRGTGEFGNSVTAAELRFLQQNWSQFKGATTFYRNGAEVAAPW